MQRVLKIVWWAEELWHQLLLLQWEHKNLVFHPLLQEHKKKIWNNNDQRETKKRENNLHNTTSCWVFVYQRWKLEDSWIHRYHPLLMQRPLHQKILIIVNIENRKNISQKKQIKNNLVCQPLYYPLVQTPQLRQKDWLQHFVLPVEALRSFPYYLMTEDLQQ